MTLPISAYVILAMVLFTLGALTVLLRRNAIIELMGVELMLNAVNLLPPARQPHRADLRLLRHGGGRRRGRRGAEHRGVHLPYPQVDVRGRDQPAQELRGLA